MSRRLSDLAHGATVTRTPTLAASHDWTTQALCAPGPDADATDFHITDEIWFDDYRKAAEAKAICHACPVRTQCLTTVMASEHGAAIYSRHGIYAGLTPVERWQLDQQQDGAA